MYVNGDRDTFFAEDARAAFAVIQDEYARLGVKEGIYFESPSDTGHEISGDIAVRYFKEILAPA